MPITWRLRRLKDKLLLLEFNIEGGVLDVSELSSVVETAPEPENVEPDSVLCISGRGPIWLYGSLIDKYKDLGVDIATYDPRLNACIVVTGRKRGTIIPLA